MAKKQSSKKRTQVKDLPRKDKKMSAGDMKKVKGGFVADVSEDDYVKGVKVLDSGGSGSFDQLKAKK